MPLTTRKQFYTIPGIIKINFFLSGFGLEGFCAEWLSIYQGGGILHTDNATASSGVVGGQGPLQAMLLLPT